MKKRLLILSIIIMGLSGICAQIIIFRELLVSFNGNELTTGIILANWLLIEAAGAFFAGKLFRKSERTAEIYVLLTNLFSVCFPFAVYLSRIFRDFLSMTQGESLNFSMIFAVSFIIQLPISFIHGALFSIGCSVYEKEVKEADSVGSVYVFETLGSLLGGCAVTFIFIVYFNSFDTSFAIGILNAALTIPVLFINSGQKISLQKKSLLLFSVSLSALFFIAIFSPFSGKLHQESIAQQWKDQNVVAYENSRYSNIVIIKKDDEYTFFINGMPVMTAPNPDSESSETFVHFAMLSHKNPQSVLVIGGGSGGVLAEILKYQVASVDYVEMDPLLIEMIKKYRTELTEKEFSDKRLRIHNTDARYFLKNTYGKYDVIFMGISFPLDLQSSRLFTEEFFETAKRHLNPHSILAVTNPSSESHISTEIKNINACLLNTLSRSFSTIAKITGDRNIYLCSDSPVNLSANSILQNLSDRKIETLLFNKTYLDDRLDENRRNLFENSMKDSITAENSDFQPSCLYYNLAYMNALYSKNSGMIFSFLNRISLQWIAVSFLVILFVLFLVSLKWKKFAEKSINFSIFSTGIAGMWINLIIIFSFQIFFGFLFHQLGLLISVFMLGIGAGGFIVLKYCRKLKEVKLFLILEGLLTVFPVFMIMLFFVFKDIGQDFSYSAVFSTAFLSGFLIGAEFPLAGRIHANIRQEQKITTAGSLYGADLSGGFLGSISGSVILFPVIGIFQTCVAIMLLKLISFVFFARFTRVYK